MKNDWQVWQADCGHAIICYENNKEKLLFTSQYVDKCKKTIKLCIRLKTLYNCMIKIDCFFEAI